MMDSNPFLEGFTSPVDKRDSSWKNISENQADRLRGRRTERAGEALTSAAGGAIGVGLSANALAQRGPLAGAKDLSRYPARTWRTSRKVGQSVPRAAGSSMKAGLLAARAMPLGSKLTAGGLGLLGAGMGMQTAGKVKARKAEQRITVLRRKRAERKDEASEVKKNAFGVEQDLVLEAVSKGSVEQGLRMVAGTGRNPGVERGLRMVAGTKGAAPVGGNSQGRAWGGVMARSVRAERAEAAMRPAPRLGNSAIVRRIKFNSAGRRSADAARDLTAPSW